MRRRLDVLPPLALPDGYTCRRLRPGEEPAWARVLNDCGQLGHWDEERVERRRDLPLQIPQRHAGEEVEGRVVRVRPLKES